MKNLKKKSPIPSKKTKSLLGYDDLSINQLKVLASDVRSDILSVCLNNGGHLSSNLGSVELTIECLRHFDAINDDIIFDVGHQAYAYKILTGRNLKDIRELDGISPFLDRNESKFDKYCSGHAGDALPVAVGFAKAKQLEKSSSYTICVTGDSSIVNGLAFESLNYLADDKIKRLIIIVNDNGMAISQNVGFMKKQFQKMRNSKFYFNTSSFLNRKMSKNKITRKLFYGLKRIKDKVKQMVLPNNFFESIGLKYIGPFNGNDLNALDLAFKKAKLVSENGPVILHLLTKKGYGYYPAMNDKNGSFHGVSPEFDDLIVEDTKENFLSLKEKYLFKKMEDDKKMIIITPAMLVGSKLSSLQNKYPERVIDVGIAEENAISFASGLALKNYHPVVDIYSTFLQRGYDEVIEDIVRNKISALFFVERAGLVGSDGASHQGLYDVSYLKTIPNVKIYMPFDKKSFTYLMSADYFSNDYPSFIRLSKDDIIREDYPIIYMKDYLLYKKGKSALIIAIGQEGFKLIKKYFKHEYTLITLLDLLPEYDILNEIDFKQYNDVIIYDPYSTIEGTVSYLSLYLTSINYKGNYHYFSFNCEFVTHGDIDSLYKRYKLDHESVYLKINKILNYKNK